MSVELVESGGNTIDGMKKVLAQYLSWQLLVGIPQEKSSREGDEPTNAELMFIHTHGSPLMHIPPRPIIEPAIESEMDKITNSLIASAVAAISGDLGEAERLMDDAGTYAENACIKRFGSSELAPNAPITVNGGWMRNYKSGKPFFVKGKHSDAPLIDEGSLKGSITHVIRKG